jgi:Tol biopolymer transport system component
MQRASHPANPATTVAVAVALVSIVATAASVAPAAAAEQKSFEVVPWTAPGISSALFESHPAFDPLTRDLYFVRSSPKFEGWRLQVSTCTAQGWSQPQSPSFVGDGVEADPWFTRDGRTLYFISTRSTDGVKRKDLDLWRVNRTADGKWETPQRLPAPVNSTGNEWFPRMSRDGWLYFGSDRPGGVGKTDIWRARAEKDGEWRVENLGPSINTVGNEYEPSLSPDDSRMIIATDDAFYESIRTGDRWTPRTRLPPAINANGSEIGPLFSPSGKSLLFARDAKTELSGEFFVWHIAGHEEWPPTCGAK